MPWITRGNAQIWQDDDGRASFASIGGDVPRVGIGGLPGLNAPADARQQAWNTRMGDAPQPWQNGGSVAQESSNSTLQRLLPQAIRQFSRETAEPSWGRAGNDFYLNGQEVHDFPAIAQQAGLSPDAWMGQQVASARVSTPEAQRRLALQQFAQKQGLGGADTMALSKGVFGTDDATYMKQAMDMRLKQADLEKGKRTELDDTLKSASSMFGGRSPVEIVSSYDPKTETVSLPPVMMNNANGDAVEHHPAIKAKVGAQMIRQLINAVNERHGEGSLSFPDAGPDESALRARANELMMKAGGATPPMQGPKQPLPILAHNAVASGVPAFLRGTHGQMDNFSTATFNAPAATLNAVSQFVTGGNQYDAPTMAAPYNSNTAAPFAASDLLPMGLDAVTYPVAPWLPALRNLMRSR